ncbi:MAG: hypothetical protein WKG01_12770 [Kofleriaceae bacterium]
MKPWIVYVLLAAGCGDKVIELSLRLPSSEVAAQNDTACVTAIEVIAEGNDYPNDPNDLRRDCIEPGAVPTYSAIRDAVRGKFELAIPSSGLGRIAMRGHAGNCEPIVDIPDDPVKPDLIFYGGSEYDGGDSLVVPLVPNLSCTRRAVTAKPLDVLKLAAGGATPCVTAELADLQAGVSVGTLSPRPFDDELEYWGGVSGASLANHVASFEALMQPGAGSCVAAYAGNPLLVTIGCLPTGGRNACTPQGILEVPVINSDVAFASLDQTKITRYEGAVFGLVYGAAAPIANATVTIDAADQDRAEVVYLDMATGVENGVGRLTPLAQTSTGPDGLFVVYTNGLVTVTVGTGATTRKVRVGSLGDLPAVVLVAL